MYFTYILKCSDGSYYVGHTEDLDMRVKAHNEGRAAAYTRARRPVVLAYSETHSSLSAAVSRERQIKRWSAAKKEALIRGDTAELWRLAHE